MNGEYFLYGYYQENYRKNLQTLELPESPFSQNFNKHFNPAKTQFFVERIFA